MSVRKIIRKNYRLLGLFLLIFSIISLEKIWFSPAITLLGLIIMLYNSDNSQVSMMQTDVCIHVDYLRKFVQVTVNKPIGALNESLDYVYPINVGYTTDKFSLNQDDIEVLIIGEYKPLEEAYGRVIAVLKKEGSNTEKLVVSLNSNKYSKEQIKSLIEFDYEYNDYLIIM